MSWAPSPEVLAAALADASAHQPHEACGVVVNGQFLPILNNSTEHDAFAMDREEYYQATKDGGLEAVVHSHVYAPPLASEGDRTMCEITAVPWLIVSWPLGTYAVIEPSGYRAPLIGRTWCFGALDCWSMARDGFEAFTGIVVPDFDREWEWWRKGQNTIVDNVEAAGFVNLGQVMPRHCDMVVMQIRSPVPNHVAVYLEPEGIILHHLQGRVSVRETYGGFYQKATVFIARHKDLLDASPPLITDRSIWTGEVPGQEPS